MSSMQERMNDRYLDQRLRPQFAGGRRQTSLHSAWKSESDFGAPGSFENTQARHGHDPTADMHASLQSFRHGAGGLVKVQSYQGNSLLSDFGKYKPQPLHKQSAGYMNPKLPTFMRDVDDVKNSDDSLVQSLWG